MALSDFDLYLFSSGTFREAYDRLGAHLSEQDGMRGVRFAVWAPDAGHASVIGDFNGWNPTVHPLHPVQTSEIWEGFVPGVGEGALYKFALQPRGTDEWLPHADPYAA